MFEFLKGIFFRVGELLSFATPETQREYSSNFLVSMSNGKVCVNQCIHSMFIEVVGNEFEMDIIRTYGERKIESV